MDKKTTRRYIENYFDEVDGNETYRVLASLEKNPTVRDIYERMAKSEEKHEAFWAGKIREIGAEPPKRKVSSRAKFMFFLARIFGPSFVLPTIASREIKGGLDYLAQAETKGTNLAADERSHERILTAVMEGRPGQAEPRGERTPEKWHRAGGNALRAAVLGANDGLLSNLSLVMGVAGAAMSNQSILITGLAGMLAGASSMALGEWISVQNSRELYQRQIEIERLEIEGNPLEEQEELALIYESKGLSKEMARTAAARIMEDHAAALDTLTREELGLDPAELSGSAWVAAFTSFGLFAAGAVFPVFPFLILTGSTAILTSLAVSTGGLFLIGAGTSLFTGRNLWFSGFRQVLFGLIAAGITFGVGKLIGYSVMR